VSARHLTGKLAIAKAGSTLREKACKVAIFCTIILAKNVAPDPLENYKTNPLHTLCKTWQICIFLRGQWHNISRKQSL
jgi:hypothetical protein